MEAVAAGISLAGYVQVLRRHWSGLAIWAIANALWLWLSLSDGHWAQAAMWAVYLAGAVWGAAQWRRS